MGTQEVGPVSIVPDDEHLRSSKMNIVPDEEQEGHLMRAVKAAKYGMVPYRGIQSLLGDVRSWATGQAEEEEQKNLVRAAKGTEEAPTESYLGEATPPGEGSTFGYRSMADVAGLGAGAVDPKNMAIMAGAAIAPQVVGPVLMAHGAGQVLGQGKQREALINLITKGEANPDDLQAGLGSLSEISGGGAITGAARGPIKLPAEDPMIAAKKVLRPSREVQFEKDFPVARQQLLDTKSVASLRTRVSAEKQKAWQPADDAFKQYGSKGVPNSGDEISNDIMKSINIADVQRKVPAVNRITEKAGNYKGTYTIQEMENMRLQTVKDMRVVKAKYRSDQQAQMTADPDLRALQAEHDALTKIVDREISKYTGGSVNLADIRAQHGPLQHISRLAEKIKTAPPEPPEWMKLGGEAIDVGGGALAGEQFGHPWYGAAAGRYFRPVGRLIDRIGGRFGRSPSDVLVEKAFRGAGGGGAGTPGTPAQPTPIPQGPPQPSLLQQMLTGKGPVAAKVKSAVRGPFVKDNPEAGLFRFGKKKGVSLKEAIEEGKEGGGLGGLPPRQPRGTMGGEEGTPPMSDKPENPSRREFLGKAGKTVVAGAAGGPIAAAAALFPEAASAVKALSSPVSYIEELARLSLKHLAGKDPMSVSYYEYQDPTGLGDMSHRIMRYSEGAAEKAANNANLSNILREAYGTGDMESARGKIEAINAEFSARRVAEYEESMKKLEKLRRSPEGGSSTDKLSAAKGDFDRGYNNLDSSTSSRLSTLERRAVSGKGGENFDAQKESINKFRESIIRFRQTVRKDLLPGRAVEIPVEKQTAARNAADIINRVYKEYHNTASRTGAYPSKLIKLTNLVNSLTKSSSSILTIAKFAEHYLEPIMSGEKSVTDIVGEKVQSLSDKVASAVTSPITKPIGRIQRLVNKIGKTIGGVEEGTTRLIDKVTGGKQTTEGGGKLVDKIKSGEATSPAAGAHTRENEIRQQLKNPELFDRARHAGGATAIPLGGERTYGDLDVAFKTRERAEEIASSLQRHQGFDNARVFEQPGQPGTWRVEWGRTPKSGGQFRSDDIPGGIPEYGWREDGESGGKLVGKVKSVGGGVSWNEPNSMAKSGEIERSVEQVSKESIETGKPVIIYHGTVGNIDRILQDGLRTSSKVRNPGSSRYDYKPEGYISVSTYRREAANYGRARAEAGETNINVGERALLRIELPGEVAKKYLKHPDDVSPERPSVAENELYFKGDIPAKYIKVEWRKGGGKLVDKIKGGKK